MDQRKINLGRGKVVSPKEGILDSLLRDFFGVNFRTKTVGLQGSLV